MGSLLEVTIFYGVASGGDVALVRLLSISKGEWNLKSS